MIVMQKAWMRTNAIHTFRFDETNGTPDQWAVGLCGYYLTYPQSIGPRWVEVVSIDLQPSLDDNNITINPFVRLQDSQGHTIDHANSSLYVWCIACYQNPNNEALLLSRTKKIDNGQIQGGLSAIAQPSTLAACLSGFDLRYQDKDNEVLYMHLEADGSPTVGSSGAVRATAIMNDNSQHFANGSINGVLLTADSSNPLIATAPQKAGTNYRPTFKFSQKVSDFVVALMEFEAGFPDNNDQRVYCIWAGATLGGKDGWSLGPDGMTVTINSNIGAGIQADNDWWSPTGSVTLQAFGIPVQSTSPQT